MQLADIRISMRRQTLTPTVRRSRILATGLLGLAVSLCLHAPASASADPASAPSPATVSTPSPATHRISALCAEPSPGHSGCLGLRLASDEPTAEESPIAGSLSPANVLTAYGLTGVKPPSAQTIALVDAYDDPTAEADLATFDSHFGLPACTKTNGCFRKVNQSGTASPLPAEEGGWAQEIATDVEVAHGICQNCRILLVEASSNNNSDLYAAEQTAVRLEATEISNSWGGEEPAPVESEALDRTYFNHPDVVITASSGDAGYLDWLEGGFAESADYPASSPHVISVGGTRLALSASGAWEGETVWNDGGRSNGSIEPAGAGGGGCSARFTAGSWQQSLPDWSTVGCGSNRAVADVSADADPWTGVAVYDSTETPEGEKGWAMIGGTSVASPIIAASFALAGGAHGVAYPAQTLYENLLSDPASLHDVNRGSNGKCLKRVNAESGKGRGASTCSQTEEAESCAGHAICLAGIGYDGPTGVGTPDGIDAFRPSSEHKSEGTISPGAAGEPAQPPPGSSQPGTSGSPSPASTTPPGGVARAKPAIGSLRLTSRARSATARRHARLSQLAFTFSLNVAARVRLTIAKLVRVHGRSRWVTVSAPLSFLARTGAQSRALAGRKALASGRYRLTLTPAGGVARSLLFSVR